jgi:hypothetical protein
MEEVSKSKKLANRVNPRLQNAVDTMMPSLELHELATPHDRVSRIADKTRPASA